MECMMYGADVFDGVMGSSRQGSNASTNSLTSDIFDEADERDGRRSTLISSRDTNKTMLFQVITQNKIVNKDITLIHER